ncbi:MAG: ABC transporter permease, partial [Nitrososphaerales archaeon]
LQNVPVITVFSWLLPYTIELAALALFIILLISIPLGNLSAVYRNRPIDQASRVMSFSGFALPAFLLGSLLLVLATVTLGSTTGGAHISTPWCPSGELAYQEFFGSWPTASCFSSLHVYPLWMGGVTHAGIYTTPTGFPTIDAAINGNWWLALDTVIRMIIPALVIAFGTIATLLRFVRNSMLEVMSLDFVRTARAKGVPEKVVVNRHAGRNSLNVTITVLGLTFAFFIGGFPVIESVFGLNGVGYILAQAVIFSGGPNGGSGPDIALIFGSTLLFTYLVVTANIVVDVLYAYLDPRVRLG